MPDRGRRRFKCYRHGNHVKGRLHNACPAPKRYLLKFDSNSILSNLTKNRVAFASTLEKTVASSPTTASTPSA